MNTFDSTGAVETARLIPAGWSQEDWDHICLDIQARNCIPIIGRSLTQITLGDSKDPINLYKAFMQHFNKEPTNGEPSSWTDELFFSRMREMFNEDQFKNDFLLFVRQNTLHTKTLEDLLGCQEFPAIINLCPSGAVQKALRNLKKPFHIINVSETEGVPSFIDQPDDILTLINVFGSIPDANSDDVFSIQPQVALATHQQLAFLMRLAHENTADYLPRDPKSYHYLGVGCQTPDWLGRILIHWLADGSPVSAVRMKSVESSLDRDDKLEAYATLGGQNFKFIHSDPLEFSAKFSEYTQHVRTSNPQSGPAGPRNGKTVGEQDERADSIFMSFIGDPDREPAMNLFERINTESIQKKGLLPPLFIDTELEPGDHGMLTINRKLESAKKFIVFVSLRAMQNVSTGDNESDAFHEWKAIAKKRIAMGERNNSLFVVFVYDREPKTEHLDMKRLIETDFGDSFDVYYQLFLSTKAPQVIFYPRNSIRHEARSNACKTLSDQLISGVA